MKDLNKKKLNCLKKLRKLKRKRNNYKNRKTFLFNLQNNITNTRLTMGLNPFIIVLDKVTTQKLFKELLAKEKTGKKYQYIQVHLNLSGFLGAKQLDFNI